MPEYVLDTSDAPQAWHDLDSFAQGFIEAAFFCETACIHSSEFFSAESQEEIAEGRADGNIPEDSSVGDIAPDEFAPIAEFCAAFQRRAAPLLALAYERPGYDEAAAGRDLYFTTAGHGVGFWSRDQLNEGGLGDALSEVCGRGEVNLFADADEEAPGGFFITFSIWSDADRKAA